MASWFLENFPYNCLKRYLCNSSSFHFLDTEYLHTLWRLKESSVKTCNTKHYTFWPLWHLTDISYFALSPFARESANTTAALNVSQCLHFISPCWSTQAHCHVWSMLQSPCFCCQANTLCWQRVVTAVTSPLPSHLYLTQAPFTLYAVCVCVYVCRM